MFQSSLVDCGFVDFSVGWDNVVYIYIICIIVEIIVYISALVS